MEPFTAYFDASGTPADTVLTMAGYVSDVRKWTKFEQCWKTILQRENVSAFHMTDCISGQKEYKGWTKERRGQFLHDLSECAIKYTNKRFSASVIISGFDRADREFTLHEAIGYPYAICGTSCIEHVRKWARNRRIKDEQIIFMFEDGDLRKGDFQRICEKNFGRFGIKPVFKKKRDFIHFQAADLAAWKTRYPLRESEGDKPYTQEEVDRLLRLTHEYLSGRNRHAGGGFNYDSFMKIINGAKIPRRP
jgi:hypothetical protein